MAGAGVLSYAVRNRDDRHDHVKFARRISDVAEHMLRPAPPLSNAQRQREFQASHPGYDRRRKARQRASSKRAIALRLAALEAQIAEEKAAEAKAAETVGSA
jgi:hypothetical protein